MSTYDFVAPLKINGAQLIDELKADDVYLVGDRVFVIGDFSKEYAENIIAAHNPLAPTEPTIEQKLASVGLSVNDLKAALGL